VAAVFTDPASVHKKTGAGTQLQGLNPVSLWQPNTLKKPTQEQLCLPVSRTRNELRGVPLSDSHLTVQILDCVCMKIIAKFGTTKPEKLEPMLKCIRPRSRRNPRASSTSGCSATQSQSRPTSSSTSSIAHRRSRESSPDPISPARLSEDVNLMYFEREAVNGQFAAFVGTPFNTMQHVMSFVHHRDSET
jgi:hypothetical protein